MQIFLALLILALGAALWALIMYRFRLRWWTIIATVLLLAVLFVSFFRPEDEETGADPESRAAESRYRAT